MSTPTIRRLIPSCRHQLSPIALLTGAAFTALMTDPAMAADLAVPVYKGRAVTSFYDWTGLYIGAHVGWENADSLGLTSVSSFDTAFIDPFGGSSPTDQKLHGWLGGVQLGYNHQFRRVVLGLEFSGSWDNVSGQSSGALTNNIQFTQFYAPAACYLHGFVADFVPGGTTNTYSCSAKQDWTIQALVRLGYAFGDGRLLPYITGGAAFTHFSFTKSFVVTSTFFTNTHTIPDVNRVLTGAILGTDIQYALGNGLSIGAEYVYTKYPSQDFSGLGSFSVTGVPPGSLSNSETHDLASHTVRAVLNYKISD